MTLILEGGAQLGHGLTDTQTDNIGRASPTENKKRSGSSIWGS